MKRVILVAVLTVAAVMGAFGQEDRFLREYYLKITDIRSNRDIWLYEFNNAANSVIRESNKILAGDTNYVISFEHECKRYTVLLNIGVESGHITDIVRQQQMSKIEIEKKKIAQYLASKSSGLGLE